MGAMHDPAEPLPSIPDQQRTSTTPLDTDKGDPEITGRLGDWPLKSGPSDEEALPDPEGIEYSGRY